MKEFLKAVLRRLKEPSTMAGISALGILVGVPPGTIELAAQVVIGVTGIAAVLIPGEQKPEAK